MADQQPGGQGSGGSQTPLPSMPALVGAVGGAQPAGCGRVGVGEFGKAGAPEPVVGASEVSG